MAFDCCQNFDLAEYPENEEMDFVQNLLKPASDACPTGDQEIVGLIPTGSGNILSWRWIMKCFLRSSSFFYCFKKGNCQLKFI